MPDLTHGEYCRDADTIGYVSRAGLVYIVTEPDAPEPVWKRVDFLSDDAESSRLSAEEREDCERSRIAYCIPE
jgi:hypothetical protein